MLSLFGSPVSVSVVKESANVLLTRIVDAIEDAREPNLPSILKSIFSDRVEKKGVPVKARIITVKGSPHAVIEIRPENPRLFQAVCEKKGIASLVRVSRLIQSFNTDKEYYVRFKYQD